MIMISPILENMTPSQLHAMMSCGLASIDGALIAVFDSFGVSGFIVLLSD